MVKSLRRRFRPLPREAWICALVACLNAVCWSFVTPPFQVPDEPDHFAYVQQLANAHHLPNRGANRYSAAEEVALADLHASKVRHRPGSGKTIGSQAEQRRLEGDLRRIEGTAAPGEESAGLAASEPPLYYALQAIPYKLGSAGSLLDSLALVRLASSLFAGITALFAFLFLREALPRLPWAWVVGGLAVALFPLLGFMSGAVTPESMLYAVAAVLFYLLARAFRRSLTAYLAAAIGITVAVGLLTKLNFVGLLPGTGIAIMLLAVRVAHKSVADALRAFCIAIGLALSPLLLFAIANLLSNRAIFGGVVADATNKTASHGSIFTELSYIWQLYLPPLPGMHGDFVGLFISRRVWFNGWVGLYGWLDTTFPGWVYELALLPAGVVVMLGARELLISRSAVRARVAELTSYMLMALGLMALVGADGYLEFPLEVGNYAQPRYLMPLVVFWGVLLTLAARGAGRRWGPAVGTLLVLLVLAQDIFSQLLVIGRYYG
jgi:4-amino-4-deoxy-L-arabinose transferase-like glycosyltransferase